MKLGVNIIGLFPGKIGGAEQYIRNIISEMEKHDNLELFLFLNSTAIDSFVETERLRKYQIDLTVNIESQLNYHIDDLNLDVWYCPLFHLNPPDCKIPSAVAIFDIQQEFFPKNFSAKELLYRKKNTQETLCGADLILTISEFSKQTMMDKYSLGDNQIKVIYLDADKRFMNELNEEHLQSIRSKYNLPEQYIFYPANSWPHKNHIRLVEAFARLKRKGDFKPKLVLTGTSEQSHSKLNTYIQRHRLQDDVIYLGYVTQDDMPAVFANASMLVFPSLFEGFGIPLLEAMRVGIPIACSKCGSIPEVVEDAALYFDAYSVNDIADKIYTLHHNIDLARKLVENGRERVKYFSWERCAQQTIESLSGLCPCESLSNQTNQLPLVTIITPSYNQGQFIKETIDSVLNQNYPNLEYIVVDGGSTDNTVDILKQYGDRITWVSEKDEGQADAVNKGLAMSNGEIIGWLNSDDTYLDGAVSKAVAYLNMHPRVDMVYGKGYYTDENSKITGKYMNERFSRILLAERCLICQPAAFFRKSIINTVGELDPSLQLCMDYDLWMRIAFKGHISYIDDYLATSRLYLENKTMSRRPEIFREVCKTVKKHYGYVPPSWALGHADYLCNGGRGKRFYFFSIMFFIRSNISNPKYLLSTSIRFFISKISTPPAIANAEGQYADKWVSKVYEKKLLTKEPFCGISISGQHIWPIEQPLQLRLYMDDKHLSTVEIKKKGHFEEYIEFTECLLEGYHELRLEMPTTFVPMNEKWNSDDRELSFILDNIQLVNHSDLRCHGNDNLSQ